MVVMHPGIYQFELPYLSHSFVPDSNGMVPVYTCDVEIHVADDRDSEKGFYATVIIGAKKGGVGVTNYIEHLATQIKRWFIDEIVKGDPNVVAERIRWIERNYYPKENYQEVKLIWDEKSSRYHSPCWFPLENDWIIKENKLTSYEND